MAQKSYKHLEQEYYRRIEEAGDEIGYEDAYFIVRDILNEYTYGARVIKRFQRHFADIWHGGQYEEGCW